MLIDLDNVAKQFGAEEIFFGVSAGISPGQRIGLIGANGAGKTTLLEVITGQLEPDEGRVSRSRGTSIGYLKQDSGLGRHNTVMQEMRLVFSQLLELEKRMQELTKELGREDLTPQEQEDLTREYAEVQELYEVGEGYNIDVKIATVLTGMGFRGEATQKVIDCLSGGERTRLALCKQLLENPDLLILDEPTNHLDFRTLLWLEDYLATYKGALLVVSHDRYFLDKLVEDIWEIENTRFYTYKGNYSKYVGLKDERVTRQKKEYEQQQQEIAAMQDYVARNIVRASTSAMAKSRLKSLQRMERVERPTLPPEPIKLQFESEREPVKDVLSISGLELVVGEGNLLASGLEIEVKRGEKIALVGANGAGKTTLLRVIQNQMQATGRVVWGRGVSISYYDQGTDSLTPSNTVLEEIHATFPKAYELTLRSMLGRVGLTGEDSFKLIQHLSGGECARVKFAIMMLKKGNVLILDEPTNHLDFSSKEALDKALGEFDGTVIMVSHDRYLLDRVPDRIVEFSGGELLSYKGGFTQYAEYANLKPTKENTATEQKPKTAEKGGGYNKGKQQRREQAARKKALTETEAAIADTEAMITRLEHELAQPEVQSDFVRLDEICAGLDDARTKLALLMEDWVELQDEEA